ncbi:MAG: alcohol dehydrogenase [Marmoricola sp.]|nr:alcohol dehydrogenase [Marmoricola sp.]
MHGVVLPGDSTVADVRVPVPQPGPGQVLLAMRASSICGSDIRAIYREHLGHGAEAYRGVIAGHEPCGEVVAVGPGCKRLTGGERVVVYHIVGCGQCQECRTGYEIGCTDASRQAYGWQRDGGHADYLLAEERSCLVLPEQLSFVDGALVSCGFGTAWEALRRLGVSGADGLLVTGLGPVGLAAAMLGRALGAGPVLGVDIVEERRDLALELGLVDHVLPADDSTLERVNEITAGAGCSTTVDCSGSAAARSLAVRATSRWGRCAFVGEGGDVTIDVSQHLIHKQVTVIGSWVTSVPRMAELLERLDTWGLHPEELVTHRFGLHDAATAYETADRGSMGKVCIVWE